jgi:cellulose biosynthesis protein BcsQ
VRLIKHPTGLEAHGDWSDSSMTILAIFHMKGGVGKTATAVNLSYLAAQDGHPTLICDLDPQGSATYYFRVKPKVKGGAKVLIKGGQLIDRNLKGTDYDHLDLLPAAMSYRHAAGHLEGVKRSKHRLEDILKPLRHRYRYVVLDCPPNLTRLTDNIFVAADRILMPIVPSTLAVHAYQQLLTFCRKQNYDTDKIRCFFSMVETRKTLHQQIMQEFSERDERFLQSVIPYAAAIEKMGLYREPVVASAPRSVAAQAYQHLWQELQTQL